MRLIFQKVSLSTFLTPVFVFLVQTQYFEGVFGKNHLNHVKYIVPQKNTFFVKNALIILVWKSTNYLVAQNNSSRKVAF